MPSLKTLKTRVKSIKSTQKITKAMQMVAASKLKKARNAASQGYFYAHALTKLITSAAEGAVNSPVLEVFLGLRGRKCKLIVVFSSDRGLCGAFNGNVIKHLQKRLDDLHEQSKDYKLIFIGKKAYEHFKGKYKNHIIEMHDGIIGKDIDYNVFHELSLVFLDRIKKGEFNSCEIIYNEFHSVIKQQPTTRALIPIDIEKQKAHDDKQDNDVKRHVVSDRVASYSFDPSEEVLIEHLLPHYFTVQLYNAALVSNASEQASRMTAMDNATRNSGELIKKLSIVYNRTRQAYITKELIEIISGSEAV